MRGEAIHNLGGVAVEDPGRVDWTRPGLSRGTGAEALNKRAKRPTAAA